MMGYYGSSMMGVGSWSLLGSLFTIVILIDLILLGMWLFKQIQKK